MPGHRFPQGNGMRVVKSIEKMHRLVRKWRQAGERIGFVPTMGCLHTGHLSLVKRARGLVGREGKIVVSIYVNPAQFGPKEDFKKYTRPFEADAAQCRQAGV